MGWKWYASLGLTYLRTRDWRATISRIVSSVVWYGLALTLVVMWQDTFLDPYVEWGLDHGMQAYDLLAAQFPMLIPVGTAILFVWSAAEFNKVENIPARPLWARLGTPVGSIYCVYLWAPSVHPLASIVLAIPTGLVCWILVDALCAAIIRSCMRDPPSRSEHRQDRTNDPYGDPHAARILDDE